MSVTSKMKKCTLDLGGSGLIPAPVRVIYGNEFSSPTKDGESLDS